MTAKPESRVTTSHWGAFRVLTENNRIVGTEDFAADPNPSRIADILPAAVHHKSRVALPSIRRGWLDGGDRARDLRGRDKFVELPWDEALDITKSRQIFGASMTRLQLIQAKLGEMYLDVDACSLLIYRAACSKDNGAERITKEAPWQNYSRHKQHNE